ncbi:ABC [Ectocarpus sp. CCAP 1310/34]|nr:ABC [Ectocarpus sp. CCAP 1310/34]
MQFVLDKGKVAASACLALAYACLSARQAYAFGLGLRPIPSAASSFHPGGMLPNTVDVGSSGGGPRGMSMYSAFKKGGGKGKKKKGGGGKKSAGGRGGGGKGGGRGGGRGDGGPPSPTVDTSRKDFVYQMNRLSKSFGKGTSIRPVLKDVSLSFYPGAKIGVLGSNGSGKSTLMKGESRLSDWAKVGYLEQEPKLDDGDTVSSNIEAAVVPTRTLLKEYEEAR